MNGKLNLFIRCFICFCAYFYSVSTFAGYYSWSKPTCIHASPTDAIMKCHPNYPQYLFKDFQQTTTNQSGDIGYNFKVSSNGGQTWTTAGGTAKFVGDPTPAPSPIPTPPPKDCSPLKGRLINAAANDQGQICAGECRANPVKIVQQCPSGGLCIGNWAGQYRYDGTRCNGSEVSVPPNDYTDNPESLDEGLKNKMTPYECFKLGKSSGIVNGQTVCTGKLGTDKTNSQETSTETKTNPDGTTTTTTTTTKTNDEGGKITTTTETKTENKDVNGNTTGTASSTAKEEVDRDTYCKKNPNDEKCKAGTVSGACDKPFTCSGDVIACESAKVGWLDFCAGEKEKEENIESLAEFEKSKNYIEGMSIVGGEKEDGIKKDLGIDGSNSFELKDLIDMDGWLSGGSLQDKTFTLEGKSFSIPFSKMNYWLKMLGDIAVMVTFLACVRIVLGGAK